MEREADRYVFVELPDIRCPKCGSDRLKTTRSANNGDGSRTRTTNCRACGWRFYVVVETAPVPNLGNAAGPVG